MLERDADAGGASAWTMTSPRRERADAAAVDALLRELEMATRLRAVEPGRRGGPRRAPRPRASVTMGALEYRFALGADAPRPDGAAYMRIDGEGTFVVGRSLKVQLLRGADAYRDRTLVPYGASGIARLEVRGGLGCVVRARASGGDVPSRREAAAGLPRGDRPADGRAGRRARRELPRRRDRGPGDCELRSTP